MSSVLKATFLYALTSSNINRFSKFYSLILLLVPSDVITDVVGQCFSKVLLVYIEFRDYESGTLNF